MHRRVKLKRSRKQSLYRTVRIACNTAVQLDSCIGKRILCSLAYASADKRIDIVQGTISVIMNSAGFSSADMTTLPDGMVSTIESCNFFESIPIWAVTLIGGFFITVLSFIMIMSVYGRFFRLYMYTALGRLSSQVQHFLDKNSRGER